MRRIALGLVLASGLLGLAGCEKRNYTGKTTIEKVDGRVVSVKVVLPNHGHESESTYNIQSREELDRFINGLESLTADLKAARDQMPVVEPPPPPKQ